MSLLEKKEKDEEKKKQNSHLKTFKLLAVKKDWVYDTLRLKVGLDMWLWHKTAPRWVSN